MIARVRSYCIVRSMTVANYADALLKSSCLRQAAIETRSRPTTLESRTVHPALQSPARFSTICSTDVIPQVYPRGRLTSRQTGIHKPHRVKELT